MKLTDSTRLCNLGLSIMVFGAVLHLLLGGWAGEIGLFAGAGMILWSEVAPLENEG